MDISVVIPLLNEEESLPELSSWIDKVMIENSFTYEILFIDDGSTDNSLSIIKDLAKENSSVKALSFNRNYGKSAALDEGFKVAQGDVVITMDADLQDSPDEIPDLYNMIMKDGYDLVSGWKKKRYDPITKTIPTKLYNWTTRKLTKIKLHDFNCGLKAYKNQVVKSVEVYGEMHRYIPVMAKWNGFKKIGEKVVQHRARKYGKTKFGLERFINGMLDLLSILFVTRFRKKPMHFFGSMGVLTFIIGFIISAILIGEKIYARFADVKIDRDIVDKPMFYIALLMVNIGVVLFLAGFLGELIHNSNSSKKGTYLIKEKVNFENK
jgi:glycosyltransferase involved in cell wall biosynthesis